MSRIRNANKRCIVVFGIALLGTVVLGHAQAQDCIHGPVMVPGLYGPPVWFGTAGADDWRPQLHDPRWSGSPLNYFAQTPGGADSYDGMFRMLVSGTDLYVSFQATDDTDLGFIDAVYFAFTQGTGGNAGFAVKIIPDSATAPVAAPAADVPRDTVLPVETNAGYVDWYNTANATIEIPTWTYHPSEIPTWLHDLATWRGSPGVGWAITFRVDLAALGVAGEMRMFHGMTIDHPPAGALTLATPLIALTADSVDGSTIIPRSSGDFCSGNPCWRVMSAPGTPCTAGITVNPYDVGVWDGSTLTNQFDACGGGTTPCPTDGSSVTNTVRVRVQNVPSTGITDHAVRVRIRIADWGSIIADPKAPWRMIPQFPGYNAADPDNSDLNAIFTIPQGDLTSDSSWNWSYNAATEQAEIDYTCKADPNSYCPTLLNPAGETHQCMLIELGKAPFVGQEYGNFAKAAVYRNMNFTGLSSVNRVAKISLKGLKEITGEDKDRDVYLRLIRKNMPAHGKKPVWTNAKAMVKSVKYASNRPRVPMNAFDRRIIELEMKKAKVAEEGQPIERPPVRVMGAAAAKVPVLKYPTMAADQALGEAWPTFVVKPYYDTGKTITVKKKERKVLQPMASFGLYLSHDGPLFGFSYALDALGGIKLDSIGSDWYVVRKVKSESAFKVSAKITAEEKPKPAAGPGPGPGDVPPPCPTCGSRPPGCKPQSGTCNCVLGNKVSGTYSGALVLLVAIALGLRYRSRKRRNRKPL